MELMNVNSASGNSIT